MWSAGPRGLEVAADLDDAVELVRGFWEEDAVGGLEAGAAAAGATEAFDVGLVVDDGDDDGAGVWLWLFEVDDEGVAFLDVGDHRVALDAEGDVACAVGGFAEEVRAGAG